MRTFQEFLAEAAQQGRVYLLFEQGMYSLIDDLERIVAALREVGIPFEVIGGVAVNAHILDAHRSRSCVTRDIDLLVRREDFPKIVSAAAPAGYAGRKMMGGFLLIRSGQEPE